jgi:hypothetical protein
MNMFTDSALSRRKLLSALCALSMLLINVPLVDGSLRRNALGIEIVETSHATAPAGLEGTFEKVWVEHNVKVGGKNGMRIHAKFSVKNGLNVECLMTANFFTKDGAPLRAKARYGDDSAGSDSSYSTAGGNVAVWRIFTPKYNSSEYADVKLFLPNSALNLKQSGIHDLKLFVVLSGQGKKFAESALYNFRYTKD